MRGLLIPGGICANNQDKQFLTLGKRPGLDRSLRGGLVGRRL